MRRNLLIPNPDRELTDAKIKGWPLIISRGIIYGALPVHPQHRLNVTGKHEIHIAVVSYYDLILNPFSYSTLENSIITINKTHGIKQ